MKRVFISHSFNVKNVELDSADLDELKKYLGTEVAELNSAELEEVKKWIKRGVEIRWNKLDLKSDRHISRQLLRDIYEGIRQAIPESCLPLTSSQNPPSVGGKDPLRNLAEKG
jgi:hypothetical protein